MPKPPVQPNRPGVWKISLAPDVHRHPEAPTGMRAEEDFGARALLGRELIRSHQLHGGAGKDLLAAMPAFVQHHAAEGEVVIDRRDEPASARFEGRLGPPGTVRHVVKNVQRVRLTIEEVERRQAVEFFGRHVEGGVFHAERIEDALAQERAEGLSRHARDQGPQHVAAHVIHPPLARLRQQRQRAELLQPFVQAGACEGSMGPSPPIRYSRINFWIGYVSGIAITLPKPMR